MMGGGGNAGGMMGDGHGVGGARAGFVPASRVRASAAYAARSAKRTGSMFSYSTQHVNLVAIAAPGSQPGMFWQLDGVNNATITVPAGATLNVEFANGDPGHRHGFELTTAAPPYSFMAMMDGHIAAHGAFIMPVRPPDGNSWYVATATFHAPAPGTYHIICPVPGHAQQGMWAKLVVR
jgi:rusticyanin